MRIFSVGLGIIALALLSTAGCAVAGWAGERLALAGTNPVEVLRQTWRYPKESRTVPVKIYYPGGSQPCPVVFFSHGLGGSREGYEYLGRYWAGHGYISVHLQHLGSDTAVWNSQSNRMQALRLAAADFRNAVDRVSDVRLAISEIIRMNDAPGVLRGRILTNRLGMAGHSFGAHTTLAIAGQGGFPDARIKAAIALSAPAPRRDPNRVYAGITMPLLHFTGTLDDSPVGDTKADQRRIPFDHIPSPHQYLVILEGGDHMIFSGRIAPQMDRARAQAFLALIQQSTTVFFDAWLKEIPEARAWLDDQGLTKAAAGLGQVEIKGQPKSVR